ncbi:nucleoside hydrolase [Paenibacillus sp. FSL P4-0081]|uniref:nucleoside hydrolase n=1 Tax=unclassified Paenibacillus TaxID=185978 RepID=UPI0004F80264|nr:nucleoside hydrolase [Paenibacillus sp. FSL P4-0081]AIQ31536.1 nucleoside hydrolase [Paenibacillus sp. FSL P4-0081]
MILQHTFNVPEDKKIRLIINSDTKNEADDQYAIVHALLTPLFNVRGIIGAHFGEHRTKHSMLESYEEIKRLLDLMNLTNEICAFKGAEKAMPNEKSPVLSEGSEFIIREALTDDPTPLYVIFLGPITDLAAAYLKEPAIAGRLTAVWVGCGVWPEGNMEYNLSNDIHAANEVLESEIPLWIIPQDVYVNPRVSISELAVKVKPHGDIGNYLYQQLVDFNLMMNKRTDWTNGESWSMGDSTAVSVLMDSHMFGYEMKPAPRITDDMRFLHYQNERMVRWYHYIDPRFTLEDMFAKLKLHYGV